MPRLGAELRNCSRHCLAVSASVVPNGTHHFTHDLLRTLPLKCNEFCIIKPSRGCEGEAGDDCLILPRSSFSIISKSGGGGGGIIAGILSTIHLQGARNAIKAVGDVV